MLRTWCTAAVDQHGFLNEAPEDAEGVVKRPVGFLQKKAVGASENDGSSLALALGDARHLGDLFLAQSDAFDALGGTQHFRLEMIEAGGWCAAKSLGHELDLVSLNVLNHHDLQLGQEMKGHVADCVPQDRLLDQQDVASGRLDLFANVEDVLPLLTKNSVHLSRIVDHHLVKKKKN